jgi:hypothetical protein
MIALSIAYARDFSIASSPENPLQKDNVAIILNTYFL